LKKLIVGLGLLGIAASVCAEEGLAETGVRPDEVVGLENFGGSDEALAMLLAQGFVVTDETYRQICTFYNDRGPPYFITTDSVLFAYYVNLQDGLMKLEERQAERLPPIIRAVRECLRKFWEEDGDKLSELFYAKRSSAGPEWHEASDDLDDYLKVAEALATGATAEAETREMPRAVQKELELILAGEGPAKSPLRGVRLDYAVFKPKGFYDGNEKLENFYRAVTWLRQVPFRAADADETRQAYVLCYAVKGETLGAINRFQRLYVTYVGESEYADFYDYGDAETRALSTYHDKYGFVKKDDDYWAEVLRELERLPAPRITSMPDAAAVADPGLYKGLRLMPPPTDMDNLALRLVAPYGLGRESPSGEELMALFGSGAAREVIMAREGKAIAAYDELFESAEADMPALESEYTSKLWRKRRAVYRALVRAPSDPGLPAYYRHPAWRYKDLNTALAGWAQRRYVWNLHISWGIACLAARVKPPPAFIEPNLAFFRELLELSVLTDDYFRDYGVADTRFNALSVLLVNLVDILEKQLAAEVLTDEERDYLDHYGPELAVTCGYLRGIWHDDERLPDTPFCVPFYLDLYTGNERVVGQARPRALYVLCEYEGRKYCALGGVLTYADHVGPAEGRGKMTIYKWRRLAADGKIGPPKWQEKFYTGRADSSKG
jgi:hypothetical protein